MSAEQGFLQAILADPDDDTPRLGFADWLEENGDPPRAEFIRLQVGRARLPFDDPRRLRIELRERSCCGSTAGAGSRDCRAGSSCRRPGTSCVPASTAGPG